MKRVDYAARDREGRVVFYVLLWKRKGLSLRLFDDYWRDVHGPVCARLPGQWQYWQLHVAHNEGGIWPTLEGVDFNQAEEGQFDGIAELTFRSDADRTTWFQAAAILMADEQNLFRKAIGYNTADGNSKTYVDGIPIGDPNGSLRLPKYHVMVKKRDSASPEEFRAYLRDTFAPAIAASDLVLKLRLHLFEEVDATRPPAAGVEHSEPADRSYHAAFEIAFASRLDQAAFFVSDTYAAAVKDMPKYVKQIRPFPERDPYTFVYNGRMTLQGERGSSVAALIAEAGAANQLKEDVRSLMLGRAFHS